MNVGRRGFAVYGVTEDIEHARQDAFAHQRLQRPARVHDRHAASQALRRRQRDPAHVTSILLGQHLDDDRFFRTCPQHRVDRRQVVIEPHIHDTAAYRDDNAKIQ